MDIFWLNIDLLVLFHYQFHFITEWAALLWEVAAQLDKVEDAELVSTTVTDESEDKFAHGILLGLFVVALTILFGSGIFVDIFFSFLLWPENLQPRNELVEIDFIFHWSVVRDKVEKHFSKEVILDTEDFR